MIWKDLFSSFVSHRQLQARGSQRSQPTLCHEIEHQLVPFSASSSTTTFDGFAIRHLSSVHLACAHVSHQGTPTWVPDVSQRRSLLQPLRAVGGGSRQPFAFCYRSAGTPPQPPIFMRAHRDPVARELRRLCIQMWFWPSLRDHAAVVSPT